ncbi:MAG: hypothetical protein UU49_C0028G0012 [Candidatus Magasanikbacteria bacterium GW2011_GWC2_41_17]|uniref:Uncharacterized protein n=2 Tax=Candidatus Magasanikiibacteriota TaxID=1752731 RepID=A0A0G0V932_9BACT|nr:MAG: hypothetical protein UU49_C0028G0012 [Candidatus Magasanikbacteria bacterium GW2011_GWC2_41_17]
MKNKVMYSIKNILNLRYWFSEPPYQNLLAMKIALIFFVIMLVAGVVLAILSQKEKFSVYIKRLFAKIASLLGWMGALAFVLLFFRYEATPFLARRFWYGFWLVGLIVWVVYILRYWYKQVPLKRQRQAEKERLRKYLP